MRTAAFAIALLMGGAAIAQTTTQPNVDVDAGVGVQPDGDLDVDADVDVDTKTTATTVNTTTYASATVPASAAVVQPSNANPERDARGIAVISDPAVVPAGWNGIAGTGMGGPLVDPVTGQTVDADDTSYPACTATVTDNCLQTYERGRRS